MRLCTSPRTARPVCRHDRARDDRRLVRAVDRSCCELSAEVTPLTQVTRSPHTHDRHAVRRRTTHVQSNSARARTSLPSHPSFGAGRRSPRRHPASLRSSELHLARRALRATGQLRAGQVFYSSQRAHSTSHPCCSSAVEHACCRIARVLHTSPVAAAAAGRYFGCTPHSR